MYLNTSNCCSSFPRMPSSYQVVLWKQESFVVLRPLQIEFFRNLLGNFGSSTDRSASLKETNPGRTGDVETVMSGLKATILCVDDHWSGLIGRMMLLESNGYEVLEANGGDEGLKLFLSHSVDA